MKSMTGYGKGVSKRGTRTITVELKSVNNRFLEINTRLPKYLVGGDEVVRAAISSVIRRGAVDMYFDHKNEGGEKALSVDYELASCYVEAAKELAARTGVVNSMTATELLKLNDVSTLTAAEADADLLNEMLGEATNEALVQLDAMRVREGLAAKEDLTRLVGNIDKTLQAVKQRAPLVVADYREKLRKRIEEYLGEVEVDEARLLSEVAFFADRADINEEINRLGSHISQFRKSLELESEVGRKLDFLSQEMNREINTIGSKSNDSELTSYVLAMKNELEKIKEQIRNVE